MGKDKSDPPRLCPEFRTNLIPSPLEQDMQIPSVPLKRLLFLAKRSQSRWSREGEGANYLDGEREPVH